MHPHQIQKLDFNLNPYLVIWETTRACDLACVHCRASADPHPAPDELNHKEAISLIDQVKEVGAPILIFSGGDCLKRDDLCDLIKHAKSLGIRTGAIPAVTPMVTESALKKLKDAGLDQVAFSLDADNAKDHDSFRQVEGVYDRTLKCIEMANRVGLRTQINSLINVHNEGQLDRVFSLVKKLGIVFWEIFFLVPTGRGEDLPLMSAEKFEEVFQQIYDYNKTVDFMIKITEAPHYRKFCFDKDAEKTSLSHLKVPSHATRLPDDFSSEESKRKSISRAPAGVNSGKGFAFISYRGDVMPSGFLPISAGNVRSESLAYVYRNSTLFQELRNSELLKGRCGLCPYKNMCGGSRSRAYALTGDYLEEDPCCSYQPAYMCDAGSGI